MASKWKRVALTIEEKYKIIKNLENGEGATKLVRIHNIGKYITVTNIKKQKSNIENNRI